MVIYLTLKINPLRHHVEFKTKESFSVKVDTERLVIRSIEDKDENECIRLFGDPIVMEKFAEGVPREEKVSKSRFENWKSRLKNHDPFSVYTIIEKKSGEFVGVIALGHSAPGESEVSYLLHHKFWGKGCGTEANAAVIQALVPRLMLRGYEVDHKSLKKLVATARLDNPASQKILTGVGFEEESKSVKYGALRYSYGLFAKSVKNEYENFFTRLDLQNHKLLTASIMDKGVDITVEEMANSSFGQQTNAVKKR